MKITTFALLFISTFNLCYGGYFDSPKEVQQALDHGAETKIVFFVVDDSGTPVSNAMVSAGFYMNGKNENRVECKTGNNGIFIAEQMSVGEVNYVITKEGYYKTRSRIWLAGEVHKAGDVKDGKWQPYGKTYTAILNPRKDPVPMCAYYFEGEIPKLNVPLGFDLKAGDFVHPYGKGTAPDFCLTLCEEEGDKFWQHHATLTLSFTNAFDGAYIKDKDAYSDFVSDYSAATNAAYRQKLIFDYNHLDPRNKTDASLPETQYLVLRTRSRADDRGKLIESYYSKIYTPLRFGHKFISFGAYMNLTPNSANLEFDVGNNLQKNPPTSYRINIP